MAKHVIDAVFLRKNQSGFVCHIWKWVYAWYLFHSNELHSEYNNINNNSWVLSFFPWHFAALIFPTHNYPRRSLSVFRQPYLRAQYARSAAALCPPNKRTALSSFWTRTGEAISVILLPWMSGNMFLLRGKLLSIKYFNLTGSCNGTLDIPQLDFLSFRWLCRPCFHFSTNVCNTNATESPSKSCRKYGFHGLHIRIADDAWAVLIIIHKLVSLYLDLLS